MHSRLSSGADRRATVAADATWEKVRVLLPKPIPSRGLPRLGDRRVLTGVIYVLQTGVPWDELSLELGCGCGMNCWRRLA